MSSNLNSFGMLVDGRIKQKRFLNIEHRDLDAVRAIVVHQTDTPTAEAVFNSYKASDKGAHFLIDKDGTIYQKQPA